MFDESDPDDAGGWAISNGAGFIGGGGGGGGSGPGGEVPADSRNPWGDSAPLPPRSSSAIQCPPGSQYLEQVGWNAQGSPVGGCWPPPCPLPAGVTYPAGTECVGSVPAGWQYQQNTVPTTPTDATGVTQGGAAQGPPMGGGYACPPGTQYMEQIGWNAQGSPVGGCYPPPCPRPAGVIYPPSMDGVCAPEPPAGWSRYSDPIPTGPAPGGPGGGGGWFDEQREWIGKKPGLPIGSSKYPLSPPPRSDWPGAPDYLYITIANPEPCRRNEPAFTPEAPVGYSYTGVYAVARTRGLCGVDNADPVPTSFTFQYRIGEASAQAGAPALVPPGAGGGLVPMPVPLPPDEGGIGDSTASATRGEYRDYDQRSDDAWYGWELDANGVPAPSPGGIAKAGPVLKPFRGKEYGSSGAPADVGGVPRVFRAESLWESDSECARLRSAQETIAISDYLFHQSQANPVEWNSPLHKYAAGREQLRSIDEECAGFLENIETVTRRKGHSDFASAIKHYLAATGSKRTIPVDSLFVAPLDRTPQALTRERRRMIAAAVSWSRRVWRTWRFRSFFLRGPTGLYVIPKQESANWFGALDTFAYFYTACVSVRRATGEDGDGAALLLDFRVHVVDHYWFHATPAPITRPAGYVPVRGSYPWICGSGNPMRDVGAWVNLGETSTEFLAAAVSGWLSFPSDLRCRTTAPTRADLWIVPNYFPTGRFAALNWVGLAKEFDSYGVSSATYLRARA